MNKHCMCRAPFHLFYLDYGKYIIFNVILQVIVYTKEKNAILFTYPPTVSYYILVVIYF